MDYGFSIPTRGPLANPKDIQAIAERGEKLGFRYFAVPDHIIVPGTVDSTYPYSQGGDWPGQAGGECMEQLTVMAFLAGITKDAHLLTSVMVVPHRNPVHTAKIFSTLDVLTGGRIAVGIGTGWMQEEFEAIGTEPYAERGKVTDEYLRVFKELWTAEAPDFSGDYAKFSNVTFLPKPVQQPHPPIWVGGESGRALRRLVELGDVWYPIGANPRHPLNTRERYAAAVARLERLAEDKGRDPASIGRAFWANWPDDTRPIVLEDEQRYVFTGSAAEIAEDVDAFAEMGVRHMLFNFLRDTLAQTFEAMDRFHEKVRPLVSA